jgi:predicted dehydrogenase
VFIIFFKEVSGKPLTRPAWFFDVEQEGNGIVDVTTHLVDLVQWECFPEQIIDYENDIEIINSRRSATEISPSQFEEVTQLTDYPDYLEKDIVKDSVLNVYANGEFNYKIRDVHARVSVHWDFEAPEGTGDTHYSIMKGSKANLVIRQGEEQDFTPQLYIEPAGDIDTTTYEAALEEGIKKLQKSYPELDLIKEGNKWQVVIPEKYRVGHEAHFSQVTEKFLEYLVQGELPDWEVPNMIAKYYTTTKALEVAKQNEVKN